MSCLNCENYHCTGRCEEVRGVEEIPDMASLASLLNTPDVDESIDWRVIRYGSVEQYEKEVEEMG